MSKLNCSRRSDEIPSHPSISDCLMRNLRSSDEEPSPSKRPVATHPAPPRPILLTGCDLVPTGDGQFRAVPHRHKKKLTVREATQMTHYSRDSIYRLYKSGFVTGERHSPHKILIDADSLQDHIEAVKDPDFWTPERRAQYWGA